MVKKQQTVEPLNLAMKGTKGDTPLLTEATYGKVEIFLPEQ